MARRTTLVRDAAAARLLRREIRIPFATAAAASRRVGGWRGTRRPHAVSGRVYRTHPLPLPLPRRPDPTVSRPVDRTPLSRPMMGLPLGHLVSRASRSPSRHCRKNLLFLDASVRGDLAGHRVGDWHARMRNDSGRADLYDRRLEKAVALSAWRRRIRTPSKWHRAATRRSGRIRRGVIRQPTRRRAGSRPSPTR